MQPVGQYKVKTKMFLAVLSDKPQCCGEGNIFARKTARSKKKPSIKTLFFILYQGTFQCGPYNVKMFLKMFAHENMNKQPLKELLIIHNQHFVLLPAWLTKRPILGRNIVILSI